MSPNGGNTRAPDDKSQRQLMVGDESQKFFFFLVLINLVPKQNKKYTRVPFMAGVCDLSNAMDCFGNLDTLHQKVF